jgi:LuxR family maltose regulon positive regulatory protein
VAWLGLDASDNDPTRFWRHAVAALNRARPGLTERVGPLLGPPPPRSFEGVVTALINELAAQPGDGEVVLVLDDYHLIDSGLVHGLILDRLPGDHRTWSGCDAGPPGPVRAIAGRSR